MTLAELTRQEEMSQQACAAILSVMVATKKRIDAVLAEIGYSETDIANAVVTGGHAEMAKSIVMDGFCSDCIESIVREFVHQGSGDVESDSMHKVIDELKNCGKW